MPSGGTAFLGVSLMFEMLCVIAERLGDAQMGAARARHRPTPGYLLPR